MRVMQLHNEQSAPGGARDVMDHEALLLARAGHEVAQLTLPAAEELHLPAVRAGAKAVWNVEAARETTERIRQFRPDVVHVHTPFPLMSPAVFRAASAEGVPAVTTVHSYRWCCVVGTCFRDGHVCEDCVGSRLKIAGVRHACYHESRAATAALTLGLAVHRAVGTTSHSVSRYLVLTGFMGDLMVRDGYPPELIEVKPNSVADPGTGPRRDGGAREVFFAGRLVESKGVRTLLTAWERADTGGLRLVVAGDGELRPLVEAAAARDPSIRFAGWLGEEEVTSRMRAAEAVVVPSLWYEGLPLVILRSLAVGTPVLVSDLENICRDVLVDRAGWSFRTGDADDLARQLAALSANAGRAAALRPAARASYEARYSPVADLTRLEAIYEEVVRERVRRPA